MPHMRNERRHDEQNHCDRCRTQLTVQVLDAAAGAVLSNENVRRTPCISTPGTLSARAEFRSFPGRCSLFEKAIEL
jgi:hypothetical protein